MAAPRGNLAPWDYLDLKAYLVLRAILGRSALLDYKVLRGSPALAESQGSQESRVSEGRSERQVSPDLRDPKVSLEPQEELGTEDPKESVGIQEFPEGGAFKGRGVAWEIPALSARWDQTGERANPVLRDNWRMPVCW
ncbi:hypothetical protein D4764_11G0008890 [Takifugu flavidus]|uniref:Uncharacterized protein n=1 Tax=Takifugu flavidus TaxID=433684 RepID=A0A5C6PJ89_9TELE|nr:hypothetical protein D4764_11G0008890 [Takifugu flavidus]